MERVVVYSLSAAIVGLVALVAFPVLFRGATRAFDSLKDGNPWRFVAIALGLILLLAALNAEVGPRGESNVLAVLCLGVLGVFLHIWRREFVFLMGRRDEEFPGQFDKLIWAAFLIMMAPVGLWFFRSYRLGHWPEPKTETIRGRAAADLS